MIFQRNLKIHIRKCLFYELRNKLKATLILPILFIARSLTIYLNATIKLLEPFFDQKNPSWSNTVRCVLFLRKATKDILFLALYNKTVDRSYLFKEQSSTSKYRVWWARLSQLTNNRSRCHDREDHLSSVNHGTRGKNNDKTLTLPEPLVLHKRTPAAWILYSLSSCSCCPWIFLSTK